MKLTNLYRFLASIIICELAGVVSSFFITSKIVTWYQFLNKPSFSPSNWIFGPVWSLLYLLMAISLYIVWSKDWTVKDLSKYKIKKAWNKWSRSGIPAMQAILAARQKLWTGAWYKANIVLIFCTQLALNILWPIIFFGLQSPAAAFSEILSLLMAILFLILNFYRVSKTAALLLVPYLLWVLFAAVLNYNIWILN
jgi:tryptophan-rich sensory protein